MTTAPDIQAAVDQIAAEQDARLGTIHSLSPPPATKAERLARLYVNPKGEDQ